MNIELANYFALFNAILRYFSYPKVLKLIRYLNKVNAIINSFSNNNVFVNLQVIKSRI